MANLTDNKHRTRGAVGEIDQQPKADAGSHDKLNRESKRPGRDDTLDEDLAAERLEPGLRTGGKGDTGASPNHPSDHENSNT